MIAKERTAESFMSPDDREKYKKRREDRGAEPRYQILRERCITPVDPDAHSLICFERGYPPHVLGSITLGKREFDIVSVPGDYLLAEGEGFVAPYEPENTKDIFVFDGELGHYIIPE